MLNTMKFWIANEIPKELVDFLLSPLYKNARHVLAQFEHTMEFPWLHILHEIRTLRRKEVCNMCAKHGSVVLLDYFVKSGVPVKMLTLRTAAENGHARLAYIHDELVRKGKKFPFNDLDCLPFNEQGNTECVKFIVEHGHPITEEICVRAAEYAQIGCLKYLLDASKIANEGISQAAVEAGSVACLQCAVERGCPASAEVWTAAVSSVECLQYLLTTFPGYTLTDNLLLQACQTASVASFFLLQEHGCLYHLNMVEGAAKGGSMVILLLLNDLGFDCWVPSTMAAAAGAGQLELVQSLDEIGCIWDDSAPTVALMEHQAKCLEYLIRYRAIPSSEAFEWILSQTTSRECYLVVRARRAEVAALQAEKVIQDGVGGVVGGEGEVEGEGENDVEEDVGEDAEDDEGEEWVTGIEDADQDFDE